MTNRKERRLGREIEDLVKVGLGFPKVEEVDLFVIIYCFAVVFVLYRKGTSVDRKDVDRIKRSEINFTLKISIKRDVCTEVKK